MNIQDRDFNWYLSNRSSLAEKYKDPYLIISGEHVIGTASTEDEALKKAITISKIGEFIVQENTTEDITLNFVNNNVRFA